MRTEPKTQDPRSEHPPELLKIDQDYLVRWGQREVVRAVAFGAGASAAILAAALWWNPFCLLGLIILLPPVALLILFFRNPKRVVPDGQGLVVSPADGTITDLTQVVEDEFLKGPAIRVGIFLSIFSVHVNRAPVSGRVEWVCHREGAHHDARRPECAIENESNLIGMLRDDVRGPEGARILVRQVSGAIARRIVCPLEPGVFVARGGLVGMIKYGSRTELFLPAGPDLRICVKPGDKVSGGSTIIAQLSGA